MLSPSVRVLVEGALPEGSNDLTSAVKYVPEWFPGAGFKTFAKRGKEKLDDFLNLPFQHVKESLEVRESTLPLLIQAPHWNDLQEGALTTSSIVGTCLEELPELAAQGIDQEVICGVNGSIYLGECQLCGHGGMISNNLFARLAGEETVSGTLAPQVPANYFITKTSSAIQSFFLAATLYPEIVRLGQRELDEVLGRERLPDFSDMPRLPYISAIVKEVLRWRPPTPIGASSIMLPVNSAKLSAGSPHRLMKDDVYKGWFIPAGATIMDNTWYAPGSATTSGSCLSIDRAMFRNESVYPNAHAFNPDRF